MTRLPFHLLSRALAAGVACGACGCSTTGDPTQGGLFGWSETKAKMRIEEKQQRLASERSALVQERRTAGALSRAQAENRGRITRARIEADERAEAERQRVELAAIDGNVAALEHESPTPAMASRARRLRAGISRIQRDESLSVNERWQRLHALDAEATRLRSELDIRPR
jgi:hypothetical protein